MDTPFKNIIGAFQLISILIMPSINLPEFQPPIIQNKSEPQITIPTEKEPAPFDMWLLNLSKCESGNNPEAINPHDHGSPSYGLFQYKKSTWIMGMRKYNLAPNAEDEELMNFIFDRNTQTELTKLILSEPNGWKHWFVCGKKIGLDKNNLGKPK